MKHLVLGYKKEFKFPVFQNIIPQITTRWRCFLEGNILNCCTLLFVYSFFLESNFMGSVTWIMFPFTAFTHICATSQHKIPMYARNKIKALKVFICLSDRKYCGPRTRWESIVLWEVFHFFPDKRGDIIGHT